MKICPKCNYSNENIAKFCVNCGNELKDIVPTYKDNIPIEIKKWNMGAFMNTLIWGIGNNVYESFWILVALIPFVGWIAALGIAIWLGLSGNEIAYKRTSFDTTADFIRCQDTWNKAGWVQLFIVIGSFVIWFFISLIMGVGMLSIFSDSYY